MQVATLFRESSTLLGASMEAGGDGGRGGGAQDPPAPLPYDAYGHPAALSTKYKLNMKLEPHDDGYETSADMLLNPANANHNHEVKCEKMEDPYSFIDDDPIPMLPSVQGPPHIMHPMPPINSQLMPGPKKRGRKKKIKPEQPEFSQDMNGGIPRPIKERKKHDRFNGMPEEEVSKRTLPDHLAENLDIIIIGINPGLFAAYKGHHYAGPGNHFWKCLYLSGLTPQQMSADEDYKLLQVGIGFTNMVSRATKGSADLTRKEIKEGSQILLDKLRKFRPKIAVFNGKLIYEVFSGKKEFKFGRQPDLVDGTNTYMWVMPSSSARCAQLPRAADKVPFYAALKKFRDYLNGIITEIDENEMVFSEPKVKSCYEAEPKAEPFPHELTDISNAVIKNEDGSVVPCKKKRGRPKKIKVEGEEVAPKAATRKAPPAPSAPNNNCDFPKKKRGRPKKVKVENPELGQGQGQGQGEGGNGGGTPSSNMAQCFSNPSPIQSPTAFYAMGTPPGNSGGGMYGGGGGGAAYSQSPRPAYSQSPRPQYSQSPRPAAYGNSPRPAAYGNSPRPPYSQSPRPHSQPFTHSDLSSEISAAISSEQLGSPASPVGPPDFEPPAAMAEDAECRLGGSPAPAADHYHYHQYGMEPPPQEYASPRQAPAHGHGQQDITSKSLSGLESLVDQIPNIAEGEAALAEAGAAADQYPGAFPGYGAPGGGRASPGPYAYGPGPAPGQPPPAGYPLYPPPAWSGHYEPVPLAYPQLPPYAQGYAPGIHVPSPNYPYYSYPHAHAQPAPAHPPGYPPYLGGF